MSQYRQLAKQVSTTIASFEHLVATETPADFETLGRARVVLVQCVNAYIAYLGSIVEPAGGDPQLRLWKEAHKKVVALRAKYSEHIGLYSASTIKADWTGYCSGCHDLVVAMRKHLAEVSAWRPID